MSTENVAVLFTDMVGSTALASSLGPDAADELRREHFSILRQAVAAAGGSEVKNLGDGLMVVFVSTSAALSCAVVMQQGVERDNRTRQPSVGLRVGLSGGEVAAEDGDYFGDPVIEAARLCARCEGGQILAADVVRAMAGRRRKHECISVGQLDLKGLPDPVDTVVVQWEPLGLSDQDLQVGIGSSTRASEPLQQVRKPRRKRGSGFALAFVGLFSVAAVAIAVSASALNGTDKASGGETSPTSQPDGTSATIRVREEPWGVAVSEDAVWVANFLDDSVSRIDPATQRSTPIKVGNAPLGVATGAHGVWVANSGDDTVSRIDPETLRVTKTISVGADPRGVAASEEAVWVTNHDDGTVSSIDPDTNTVTKTVSVGGGPWGLAMGDDALWVAGDRDHGVTRIDLTTTRVTRRFSLGASGCSIAIGNDAIWVPAAEDGAVKRISPVTYKVRAFPVGGAPTGVAVGAGAIWVADSISGTVSRLDLVSGRLTRPTSVGARCGLAFGADAVWVTNRDKTTVSSVKP